VIPKDWIGAIITQFYDLWGWTHVGAGRKNPNKCGDTGTEGVDGPNPNNNLALFTLN